MTRLWPPEAGLRGYPLCLEAHPVRPWWRWHGRGWVRLDGKHVNTHDVDILLALSAFDSEFPLAPPPVLSGQVWMRSGGSSGARSYSIVHADGPSIFAGNGAAIEEEWMHKTCLLVAGPSCYGSDTQWAPPWWSPP